MRKFPSPPYTVPAISRVNRCLRTFCLHTINTYLGTVDQSMDEWVVKRGSEEGGEESGGEDGVVKRGGQ